MTNENKNFPTEKDSCINCLHARPVTDDNKVLIGKRCTSKASRFSGVILPYDIIRFEKCYLHIRD